MSCFLKSRSYLGEVQVLYDIKMFFRLVYLSFKIGNFFFFLGELYVFFQNV